jgi:hypothetical protein
MSEFVIFTVLLASVCLNVLLFWYIKKLLQEFRYITDNYDDIGDLLGEFSNHLEKIHSLETFYGDETLGSLITHSKEVVEEIRDFTKTFSMHEGKEQDEDNEEEKE